MPNAIPYKYARCNEVIGVIVQKEPHAEVGVAGPLSQQREDPGRCSTSRRRVRHIDLAATVWAADRVKITRMYQPKTHVT